VTSISHLDRDLASLVKALEEAEPCAVVLGTAPLDFRERIEEWAGDIPVLRTRFKQVRNHRGELEDRPAGLGRSRAGGRIEALEDGALAELAPPATDPGTTLTIPPVAAVLVGPDGCQARRLLDRATLAPSAHAVGLAERDTFAGGAWRYRAGLCRCGCICPRMHIGQCVDAPWRGRGVPMLAVGGLVGRDVSRTGIWGRMCPEVPVRGTTPFPELRLWGVILQCHPLELIRRFGGYRNCASTRNSIGRRRTGGLTGS